MKNIISTILFSGTVFLCGINTAMAEEDMDGFINSGFGNSYFSEAGHPGFDDPQTQLIAYDVFDPADLDRIEPAGGVGSDGVKTNSPSITNEDVYGPVKE